MKAARCTPALFGGKPNDLAADTASHRLNFLAARFNRTENPQTDRQSGECRLNGAMLVAKLLGIWQTSLEIREGVMITEANFTSLIDQIVAAHLSSEQIAYEAARSELVRAAYSGADQQSLKLQGGRFEFGESILIGMKVLAIVWGTYKALKEFYFEVRPAPSQRDLDGLVALWTQRLVEEGLDRDSASTIARDFAAKAQQFASK